MNQCLNCGRETSNPKFCSRRCFCQVCGSEASHRRKHCDTHSVRTIATNQITVREIQRRAKFQANARIRQMARRVYRDRGLPLRCCICGYSTQMEICHKRSIAEFPVYALVSEVNAQDNLVCLCPNHHWELDHGLLSL